MCREREIFHIRRNKTTIERVYFITSQSRTEAGPAQLLAQSRGRWTIENRLQHVGDMAYDEHRGRARTGHTPRTFACLRDFAISLWRLFRISNIQAALRGLARPTRSWRCGVWRARKPEDLGPARPPP